MRQWNLMVVILYVRTALRFKEVLKPGATGSKAYLQFQVSVLILITTLKETCIRRHRAVYMYSTFGRCTKSLKTFGNRQEWFEHEINDHRTKSV
jgi:hypothetical protein